MEPLRVALADDEPLARHRLARFLKDADCDVVAELENGLQVVAWAREHRPVDALFLDIEMPGLTGLEVVEELMDPPPIIFVTAYSDRAIEAFERAALDYILKPVAPERLDRTLARLRAHLVPRRSAAELQSVLPRPARYGVRVGEGVVLMDLKRTSYFEVVHEVVWAVVGGQRYRTTWTSLSEVDQAFPGAGLLRVQRHQLLRPEAVVGLKPIWGGRVLARVAEGVELEVSRTATPKLKSLVGLV